MKNLLVRFSLLVLLLSQVGFSFAEEDCCGDAVRAAPLGATITAAKNDGQPPAPVTTVEPQSINLTAPQNEPLLTTEFFLADPTTEHLMQVHLFAERLWPQGSPSAQDNQTLAAVLRRYVKDPSPALLERYLSDNETSPWAGSLSLGLGFSYRQTGFFTQAKTSWMRAWTLLRPASNVPQLRALADRAAGELAMLLSWIGDQDSLGALLEQTRGRQLIGPGGTRLEAASMALSFMRSEPAKTFICGPFGVGTLCRLLQKPSDTNTLLAECPATKEGTHLYAVWQLAKQHGLSYRPAQRVEHVDIPLPALVHWSLNHYSVITKQQGDRYLITDQTFDAYQGRELWVTKAALDAEASGYFLIPQNGAKALPSGWLAVSDDQLKHVWGKGFPTSIDPDQGGPNSPAEGGDCGGGIAGMPAYQLYSSQIALGIADMPVGYSPPRGPSVEFILRYNSKESHLPTSPNFSNIGLKWNHNWLSYIVDDPASGPVVSSYQMWNPVTQKYETFYTVTPAPAAIERFPQGGGYERYTIMLNYYNNDPFSPIVSTGSATPFYRNQNVVERLNNTTYCVTTVERMIYTYSRSDGASSYPRKIMLTSVADRFGNTVTLSYDGSNRITGITDALGQVTTMTYGDSDPTKITRVTDPFGRSANMVYTNGVLTQITDVVGLASSFTYETGGDVINSMTTPYGTTTFARGVVLGSGFEHIRWLEATDPAGDKERMEMAYHYVVGEFPVSDPVADVPTGMAISNLIKYLACYYWDKKAMRSYAGDRTKAKSIGFARKSGNMVTDVREFVKMPNENRVWFNYPGQSMSSDGNVTLNSPSKIGRVIDDGTTQLAQASYNSLGKATETIDPLGRKMGYTYDATGLNLTEVRMTTGGSSDLLMKATYTAQNLPLTVTDANGQNTSYTYNSFGQVLTVTLPARAGQPVEKFTCTYNAQGYLTQIADPLNGTTDFTYDGYGRVQTVKDRDTYTITCDYDNLDRLTKVTFPDGTYTQTSYGRLDAEWSRDREGRWTRMWYDHLRKVVAMRDPLGRVTGLSWCRCGALSSLSDSMGRLTVWNYDTQNRLASKTFPDGKVTSYAYQPKSGRLASQTDAMGQITLYDYFGDNALKQISYPNALIATPTVSYAYDNTYGRLGSMTDGTGLTSFGYASVPTTTPVPAITGAGQLSSIDGPLTNDTATFSYDEWCRTVGSAIGGVGSSVSLDAIGRVKQLANPLGQFQYSYVNATQRLNSIIAPNGMKTIMAYQSLAQDFRVASIRHETSTATRISEHGYVYSPQGRISEWTQQADNATKSVWSYGYDNVDQLTNARATSATSAGALIKEYGWIFDGLGNRLSERFSTSTGNAVGKATYDSVNQLLTTAGGGRTQIKGQIDEPGTVTVNSSPVLVNADKTFTAEVDTQTGSNTFEVKATDLKGNIRTNQFRLDTTLNGSARTLAYDLNGNCTQDGATTYQWDAENRLVSITMGTKRSEFTYDGEGRRVRIVEKDGATTLSDYRFVWLGSTIAERRNAVGDVVQIRYLGAGEIEGTTKRYYTHDHLGSIREVIDQTGGVLARYDYSPFGERIRVGGSAATYDCQFSYTGHFHHGPTGMALTLFRAYSPATGRWLSKDPIGEAGGINLYAYVENSPINYIDPLGLFLGNYMENQRQAVNYNSSDPNRQCGGGAGMDGGAGYGAALLTGLVTAAAIGALEAVSGGVLGKIGGAIIGKAPIHHIATNKYWKASPQWSAQFNAIFAKAGMTLDDALNKIAVVGHRGPHPDEYHRIVRQELLQATRGLSGAEYTQALQNALQGLASETTRPGSTLNKMITRR